MSSSISVSSELPGRYIACLLGTLLVASAAAVGVVQWAWLQFALFERISPMRYQLHLVESAGRAVEVLGVGDSHTALGLYPDRPGVMNAAFGGESVREIRIKLRHALPRLPGLKLVLLQSQPQMLYPHRDRPLAEPYRQLAGKKDFHPEAHPDFHPLAGWLTQFDPCCRARALRETLHAISGRADKGPGPLKVLHNGYLDYTRHAKYERARFHELAAAEIASYRGDRPVPSLAAEFAALIDDLLAAGIRVVLVKYPLSQSYWQAIGEDRMRDADELFRRTAESRGLARCGSWLPLPDELHFNPDHLTLAGAKQYWPVIERCALE